MVTLQARPATETPCWWPLAPSDRKPEWATCDTDGNYVMGPHAPYAMRRWQLARAKNEWLAEHDGRDWQFYVRPCWKRPPASTKEAKRKR